MPLLFSKENNIQIWINPFQIVNMLVTTKCFKMERKIEREEDAPIFVFHECTTHIKTESWRFLPLHYYKTKDAILIN